MQLPWLCCATAWSCTSEMTALALSIKRSRPSFFRALFDADPHYAGESELNTVRRTSPDRLPLHVSNRIVAFSLIKVTAFPLQRYQLFCCSAESQSHPWQNTKPSKLALCNERRLKEIDGVAICVKFRDEVRTALVPRVPLQMETSARVLPDICDRKVT